MTRYSEFSLVAALVLLAASPVMGQPVNDDFDAAMTVGGVPFRDDTSTTEATVAADDQFSCVGPTATVWYRFTPSVDGRVEVNTTGSDYDTTLVVWTGERGSLSAVACNDDNNLGLQARVRFDAVAGTTYHIQAGTCCGSDPGTVGPGGNLTLVVVEPPPPVVLTLAIDRKGGIDRLSGGAVVRGTVSCTRPAPVFIDGNALQRFNRIKVQGFFSAFLECGGPAGTRWEAVAVDDGVRFGGGQAAVSAVANAADEAVGDDATQRVTLSPGR